jgi:hypothetical protein
MLRVSWSEAAAERWGGRSGEREERNTSGTIDGACLHREGRRLGREAELHYGTGGAKERNLPTCVL